MEYLIFLVLKHRHCYHIIKTKNMFFLFIILFSLRFLFYIGKWCGRENNVMFYRVWNFIIFFTSCVLFLRIFFAILWETYPMKSTHGIVGSCTTFDDYFHRGARLRVTESKEEGSRLVLSVLHNATWYPLFRSRTAKPRMYMFVNDAAWYSYVFVSYCFCNLLQCLRKCVHGTQMETV